MVENITKKHLKLQLPYGIMNNRDILSDYI